MLRSCYYVLFVASIHLTLLNLMCLFWNWQNNFGPTQQPVDVYDHVRVVQPTKKTFKRIPLLYVITPTVQRLEQKADLTRLSNTLRQVPRLHWVLIEDAANKSGSVTRLLKNCKLPYTHLNAKTPEGYAARKLYNMSRVPRKGVLPRNTGLDWVSTNAEFPSVIYFADDDNTYDLQVFEEMRYAQKIAVWPVALIGGGKYESPAVKNGKVVGWITAYKPWREFVCDMASFAVNTEFYMKSGRPRFNITEPGIIETDFLKRFHITLDDLEPKADNCTKILVWHTKTKKTPIAGVTTLEDTRKKYSAPELEV